MRTITNDDMYFVYILECADRSFYTGMTNNIEKRLSAHRRKIASKYTRVRLPVRIVYYEKADTKSAALTREAMIKKMTRHEKYELVCSPANLNKASLR